MKKSNFLLVFIFALITNQLYSHKVVLYDMIPPLTYEDKQEQIKPDGDKKWSKNAYQEFLHEYIQKKHSGELFESFETNEEHEEQYEIEEASEESENELYEIFGYRKWG